MSFKHRSLIVRGLAVGAVLAWPGAASAQDEMFRLIRKIQVDHLGVAGQIDSCEFSKDGKLIAGSDNHARIKFYERETGKFIREVRHRDLNNTTFAQEGKVNALGFSFDGLHFYTGINDQGLKVWDAKTYTVIHHFADGRNVDGADFSSNDKWLATAAGREVWIYERPAYRRVHTYTHATGEVNNLDFRFDNQYLATCGGSGTAGDVKIVKTSDWSVVRTHNINGSVKRVFFSPDGELYAAGARNQITKVFRMSDGAEVANLIHRGNLVTLPGDDFSDTNVAIETLQWSVDGQYLFTGGVIDGLLRVWRRKDWSFVGYVRAQAERRQIEYIDVSRDNEVIVGGDEGTLYQFKFTPAPIREAFRPDAQGAFSLEVEDADTNLPQGGTAWQASDDPGASGGKRLQALPNGGRNLATNYQTYDPAKDSPKLDFRIAPSKPGTHYVWVRGKGGSADNTVHVGLGGKAQGDGEGITFDQAAQWMWAGRNGKGGRATLNLPGAEATVNLWMGKDGVEIDKIILTTDPDYVPQAEALPASHRGSGVSPGADAGVSSADAGTATADAGAAAGGNPDMRAADAASGAPTGPTPTADAAPTGTTPPRTADARPRTPGSDPEPEDDDPAPRARSGGGCAIGQGPATGGTVALLLALFVLRLRVRRS